MNPSSGSLLIASLMISAFVAITGTYFTQPVKPNNATLNLTSHSYRFLQPYQPPRCGVPKRREGGGTR